MEAIEFLKYVKEVLLEAPFSGEASLLVEEIDEFLDEYEG